MLPFIRISHPAITPSTITQPTHTIGHPAVTHHGYFIVVLRTRFMTWINLSENNLREKDESYNLDKM